MENVFFFYESQNRLVFEPLSSYFIFLNLKIGLWQSKGMPEKSIKPPFTRDNSFDPEIICNYSQGSVKFKGICLKQECVSFIHGNVVTSYMFYELNTCSRDLNTDLRL